MSTRRLIPSAVLVVALAGAWSCTAPGDTSSAAAPTATTEQPVVYGNDDRTEYYAHPDAELRALTSESIVAMIPGGSLNVSGDSVMISAQSLGDAYGLCQDEAFREQPTAASCSGTLIDDDLVLTAGHCVAGGCGRNRWVFGYYYEGPGDLFDITTDDVFECERVVVQSAPGWGGGDDPDYAIIQLDRPATPRHAPAEFNPEAWPVSVGDAVLMVGFGSGLPAKLDDGGVVLDERRNARSYFRATPDAFGGNSGSGVFDANHRVVGILVAGEQDYEFDGRCMRVSTLSDSGGSQGGESVTYAVLAVEELCDDGWPSERLCGITAECGDDVCSLGESFDTCPEDCEDSGEDGWTCDPAYFAARDGCDCDCGVRDPDCDDPAQELFNCRPGETCSGAGSCVDPDGPGDDVPDTWICDADTYDVGDGCDCDCGAWDPDCEDAEAELFNCPPSAWCNEDGLCEDGDGPLPSDGASDPDAGFGDGGLGGFGDVGGFGVGGGRGGGCASGRTGRPGALGLALLALGLVSTRRRSR